MGGPTMTAAAPFLFTGEDLIARKQQLYFAAHTIITHHYITKVPHEPPIIYKHLSLR